MDSMSTRLLSLYETLSSEVPLDALYDAAYECLQNPIILVDYMHRPITSRQEGIIPSQRWQSLIDTGEYDVAFIDQDFQNKFLYSMRTTEVYKAELDGFLTYNCSVFIKGARLASISVLDINHVLTKEDISIIETLSKITALVLEKKLDALQVYQSSNVLLDGVLKGQISNEVVLKRMIEARKWEEYTSYKIYLFSWLNKLDMSLNTLYHILYNSFQSGHYLELNDCILLLLPATSDVNLDLICKRHQLRAVVGNSFKNLLTLPTEYERAHHTFLNMPSNEIVAYTDDYALDYFLYKMNNTVGTISNLHPVIENIVDYDSANNTELYKTLFAYLKNNRSTSKAAKELFIHRNTVDYQIKKIKNMYNVNFDNMDTVVYLYLSCIILNENQKSKM